MRREVLEGAALDHDRVRSEHCGVHRQERDHIQERPIAGKAGEIEVELGERERCSPAQLPRSPDVKGIEHFKADAGMDLPRTDNALAADIGANYLCTMLLE
jgi:hypothetical protein